MLVVFSFKCLHTTCVYDYFERVGLHDSLTLRVQVTRSLNALNLSSIALPLLAF